MKHLCSLLLLAILSIPMFSPFNKGYCKPLKYSELLLIMKSDNVENVPALKKILDDTISNLRLISPYETTQYIDALLKILKKPELQNALDLNAWTISIKQLGSTHPKEIRKKTRTLLLQINNILKNFNKINLAQAKKLSDKLEVFFKYTHSTYRNTLFSTVFQPTSEFYVSSLVQIIKLNFKSPEANIAPNLLRFFEILYSNLKESKTVFEQLKEALAQQITPTFLLQINTLFLDLNLDEYQNLFSLLNRATLETLETHADYISSVPLNTIEQFIKPFCNLFSLSKNKNTDLLLPILKKYILPKKKLYPNLQKIFLNHLVNEMNQLAFKQNRPVPNQIDVFNQLSIILSEHPELSPIFGKVPVDPFCVQSLEHLSQQGQ